MSNEKSDFGRGLVVNLVKFYEHFSNDQMARIKNVVFYLSKPEEERKIMISDNPPAKLNYGKSFRENVKYFRDHELSMHNYNEAETISYMIAMWVYGATDHLYKIEIPTGKGWEEISSLVKALQIKGFRMRQNSTFKLCFEDVLQLHNLVKLICIAIDKKLGLNPDWGKW